MITQNNSSYHFKFLLLTKSRTSSLLLLFALRIRHITHCNR